MQKEHEQYFEALQKHPRLLVGISVPRLEGEGMETLRDANDAKDWQDAVKSILVDEVRGRASAAMDENADFMSTVHASIELFQKNPDLIPGSRDFDVDLANRFAELATPYELRVEGKLQGYSIPVQPIIEQLRTRLHADRAAVSHGAADPTAAGGASTPSPAAARRREPDAPQAGVTSKAGSGTAEEDFSTLFGTIGLPNLRI